MTIILCICVVVAVVKFIIIISAIKYESAAKEIVSGVTVWYQEWDSNQHLQKYK